MATFLELEQEAKRNPQGLPSAKIDEILEQAGRQVINGIVSNTFLYEILGAEGMETHSAE